MRISLSSRRRRDPILFPATPLEFHNLTRSNYYSANFRALFRGWNSQLQWQLEMPASKIVELRSIARRIDCDPPEITESIGSQQELRGAIRFPLSLPMVLKTSQGEIAAVTRNISASGVLFELGQCLKEGTEMRYSMRMPGRVLGTSQDVLVHCAGRVVRCSLSQRQYLAAATIDEYRFAEQ